MANQLKRRFETIARGEKRLGFDPLNNEMARLANLKPQEILLDPDQPRKELGDLEDLKASIAEHGILQPLIVAPADETHYRLIAGERRYTAALALGLATVPAIVRTIEAHRLLEVQLIENLHRKDLTPFEEATAYQRLITEFSLTQELVAKRVGKTQAAVSQLLRVLDLPETIREEYKTSYNSGRPVSKSLLLEIARQETLEQQTALWGQAKQGELTVKKARAQKETLRPGNPVSPKSREMDFRYPIQTEEAVVTITFARPKATQEEIIAALEEALAGEKARVRGHAIT